MAINKIDKVKYTLKNFPDQSKELWSQLFKSNSYADVTLVCNDKKPILAHKIILSACSPVLGKIIEQSGGPHPWIYLRGIDFDEMNAIIHFMYLGEASIEQNKVNEFFEIAEDLEVSIITNSQNTSEEVIDKANKQENTKINEEQCKNVSEVEGEIQDNDTDVMFEDEYDVSNIYADAGLDPYESSNLFSNPPAPAESKELVSREVNKETFDHENSSNSISTPSPPAAESKELVSLECNNQTCDCENCGSQYPTQEGLDLHRKLMHKEPKNDPVETGRDPRSRSRRNKVNASQSARNTKNEIWKMDDEENYICIICSTKRLKTKYTVFKGLDEHLKNKHGFESDHCPACDLMFRSNEYLRLHMNTAHIRTFNCRQCAFRSNDAEALKSHEDGHQELVEGVKYNCNLCNYSSGVKATLKLHILQAHIGKSYNCVKCDFQTKDRKLLKRHLEDTHNKSQFTTISTKDKHSKSKNATFVNINSTFLQM